MLIIAIYLASGQVCFDALPLVTMVSGRIFVCHGGLFGADGVTLTHLRGIHRKREPPMEGATFEDRLMEELLWSDPRPTRCARRTIVCL